MRKALLLAAASALGLSACQERATYGDDAVDVEIAPPAEATVPAARPPEGSIEEAPPPPRLQVRVPAPIPSARMERYEEGSRPTPADDVILDDDVIARPAPATSSPRLAPLAPVARIAYVYSYALSIPRDRGAELMSRHEYACASAGPGLCQVVTAHADWTSSSSVGVLELKGQPEWINRFRAQLAADAGKAGGRLDRAVTEGVDVTRGIDETRTAAQTTETIADRIKALQRQSGGTLAQKLRIEREIAELQRQLDAQQVELRALNDRVQTARLSLQYRVNGAMAADSPTRPVAVAARNAFGLSMHMVAGLITLTSILAPLAALGAGVWWAVRRRRKLAPAVA